ncbi:MAG TPA: DUF1631 family protein [Nevskiaceae bacterium]|nr:DUF1631 family protein [Nevskiaceae bacterium]
MSATVHRLFPTAKDDKGATPAAPSNPLIDSLRIASTPILLQQLRSMFEGADDALFEMSERARNEADRKTYFDTMRMLRLEQRRISGALEREFGRNLHAASATATDPIDGIDLDRLSIQPTEELEERIALGNLSTKAEHLHKDLLTELGNRVDFMIRDLGIPISAHAFRPSRICEGFRAATAAIDLELRVRLLIYKLFDRFVVTHLSLVYKAALKVLDKNGIKPGAVVDAAAFGGTPPEVDEAAREPLVDGATREALKTLSTTLQPYRPIDAALAGELADAANLPHAPSPDHLATAQRLSLVGQMFSEILSDPHLPDGMRPLFERLRFPLIKISISDGTFFSNRGHPVRRLLAEAAETAASSRTSSPAIARRLEERLRHIAEQIDLSAAYVRPQVALLEPLPTAEIAAFLDQQREESETRRETVLGKVRRTVAQELEVHTLGRALPASLMTFLRAGWGPLMAARLIKHGMNSRPWIEAVNRLVQVLASMDGDAPTPQQLANRLQIERAIATDLAEIGMRTDKTAGALEQLRQAYADLDQRNASLTPEQRRKLIEESLSSVERASVSDATLADFSDPNAFVLPSSRRKVAAPSAPRYEKPRPSRTAHKSAPRDLPPDLELRNPNPPAPSPPPAAAPPPVMERPAVVVPPAPSLAPMPPAARTPEPVVRVEAPVAPKAPTIAPEPVAKVEAPAARVEPPMPPPETPDIVPDEIPLASDARPASGTIATEVIDEHAATESELLSRCLTVETWFRVFDAAIGQTLWLKVSRYYRDHDSILFTGFDASKTLSVRASRFLGDLVAGRSEPVNPTPVQNRAIAELRSRAKPR